MKASTLRTIGQALLGVLIAGGVPRLSHAQTMGASEVVDRDLGCLTFLNCGAVGSQAYAVDNNVATAASIAPPAAVSSAALRVRFGPGAAPLNVPTGSRVSVTLSVNGGGLDVGLLEQTSLRTYNDVNGPALQTLPINSLVNISALTTNQMQVEFPVTADFKYLELRTGGVLNAVVGGYSVNFYYAAVTMPAPLPVELLSFVGKARGSAVSLSWETASEHGSAYFQVERSAGASDEFRAIGKVAAAGSSGRPSRYSFADTRALAQAYYRLRQVDVDGKTTFSPVVAVAATPLAGLQAYPNPAAGATSITGPAGTRYALFNQLGQVVGTGEVSPNQTSELSLSTLPDGLYFLRESATGATVKVVKAAAGSGQ